MGSIHSLKHGTLGSVHNTGNFRNAITLIEQPLQFQNGFFLPAFPIVLQAGETSPALFQFLMGFVLLSICVVILLNIAPMSEKDYIAADYSLSAERQEKPVSSVN